MRRMRIISAYNCLVTVMCVSMTIYAVYFFGWKSSQEDTVIAAVRRDIPHHGVIHPTHYRTNKSIKIIHLSHFPDYYELKMGSRHFKDCPVSMCEYADKPESMPESDAIMFFTHHTNADNPPKKQRDQVWVFFSVESPIHSGNSQYGGPLWESKFNWTMSYRLDSDIKFGYGDVVKGGINESKDYYAIAKGKKKLVAWFVSNCNTQSKRLEYVKLLQKFIPVDIYGHCGNLKCGRDQSQSCRTMLERDYKFYLSFENSLCEDYVTEKLFNMMKLDVVPITRSGANNTAVLPQKMAVDTTNFASVHDMAEYLKYLDNNIEEYVSYLKWKDSYHIVEPQPFPHCLLCERVHHPDKWRNSYRNVVEWWSKGRCRDPADIKAYF